MNLLHCGTGSFAIFAKSNLLRFLEFRLFVAIGDIPQDRDKINVCWQLEGYYYLCHYCSPQIQAQLRIRQFELRTINNNV